eukprot:m.135297 g.135297  ORF g.135297 m.135297 type:complete len:2787 (+) comp29787_c4_seq1:169-8529(+)
MAARWLKCFSPKETPEMRLFCFPFAGGSPHTFRAWSNAELLNHIEIQCVHPPGRGTRFEDEPVASLAESVALIVEAMLPFMDVPFGFFGHSLGALMAYEVTRELKAQGFPAPIFLIASGSESPNLTEESHKTRATTTLLSELNDEDFLRKVGTDWNYIPTEVSSDKALLDLVLPVLRSDLNMWQTYTHAAGDRGISTPVLALGGADDTTVSRAALDDWQTCTNASFETQIVPGNHFFVETDVAATLNVVHDFSKKCLEGLPLAVMVSSQLKHREFDFCCHELFSQQAKLFPDKEAVIGIKRTLTYAQLDEESTLLATKLQSLGVKTHDKIGILIVHSEEYVIANLAIFKAGGAMFLLETSYTQELVSEFSAEGEIRLLLTSRELRHLQPTTTLNIELDGEWAQSIKDEKLPALHELSPPLTPDAAAYYTLTSGTTGKPKAVVNTHRATVLCFFGRYDMYPYREDGRDGLNVFFAWECLRAVMCGKAAVVIPDAIIFDTKRLLKYIHTHKITRLLVTPSLFWSILNTPGIDFQHYMDHMYGWMLEGEVVTMRTVNLFKRLVKGVKLINIYSSWEALDDTYIDLASPQYTAMNKTSKFAPVGVPMHHVQAYVCNEDMKLVKTQQPGDLYIGTPAMFVGYLNDEIKTKEKLLPNPWCGSHLEPEFGGPTYRAAPMMYKTGDRARIRPDGVLEVLGRSDFTVKIRGFKVAFGMVEQTIADLAGVSEVIVTAKLEEGTKQPIDLIAYIVGSDGLPSVIDLLNMKNDLMAKVPEYAVPAYWVPLDSMPRKQGESRKADRNALPDVGPEHQLERSARASRRQSPTNFDQLPIEYGGATDSDPFTSEVLRVFRHVLGDDDVVATDNFFDVGGHSLLASKLIGDLNNLGIQITITDLYQNPTVMGIVATVHKATQPRDLSTKSWRGRRTMSTGKIAIIGMAGEFPGAKNVHELWKNLCQGHDAVTHITHAQYAGKTISQQVLDNPQWVNATYAIEDAAKFDAGFFGIGPREAEIMDPQQRRFMQCAWEALEASGCPPKTGTPDKTAVFASAGIDGYMHHHLDGSPLKNPEEPGQIFVGELGSETDYIATRVSYALDVTGPSVNVQSACSSGLLAVAQAVQSLQFGDCDLAVAGASSISFPNFGYMYAEGLVSSVDGTVKPFDSSASGTVFGDGVGAVVLKRLEDAERDGDFIWAELSGAAVSNDGRKKAAYSAPSALGQESAVLLAQEQAKVTADDITYIECHATATLLGDGIEVSGLAGAFSKNRSEDTVAADAKERWCALGSIKGNIGHANCAAGITGLIKAAMCVHYKTLVPTAHYENANPKLSLDAADRKPFFVNAELTPWVLPKSVHKRICGVSSFGIGGTNVHTILEEHLSPTDIELGTSVTTATSSTSAATTTTTPTTTTTATATSTTATAVDEGSQVVEGGSGTGVGASAGAGDWHVLTFSAKTVESLRQNMVNMADYLNNSNGTADVGVIADMLHRGRDHFQFRATVVGSTIEVTIEAILTKLKSLPDNLRPIPKTAKVAFTFPGQGSQYIRMGEQLYNSVVAYRKFFDECANFVTQQYSIDIRSHLFQAGDVKFTDPVVVQMCIFAVEYSLAKTLIEFGVQPTALAGHSIGEYAAATISGVLSLATAIHMVHLRATATNDDCEPGAMLSASFGQQDAETFLAIFNLLDENAGDKLFLACANDPGRVVFSGSKAVISRAAQHLQRQSNDGTVVKTRALVVTHGFHSALMQPAATKIERFVNESPAESKPSTPKIPVTSNVTGSWMGEEVLSGDYWSKQVTGTVQFVKNIESVLLWRPTVFVELGPGTTLNLFVNQIIKSSKSLEGVPTPAVFNSMKHARAVDEHDLATFGSMIGNLWENGVAIDWNAYHNNTPRGKDPFMPTYAWKPTVHWKNAERSIYVKSCTVPCRPKSPNKKRVTIMKTVVADGLEDDDHNILVRYSPLTARAKRGAVVRLYCFPYAGGSARAFESWANSSACPSWLEVVAVELPMRGTRCDETLRGDSSIDDANEVKRIVSLITAEQREGDKIALCGLSKGALTAVEVGASLAKNGWGKNLVSVSVVGRAFPSEDEGSVKYDMDELNLATSDMQTSEAWETYLKPLLEADLLDDARASRRVAKLLASSAERVFGANACSVHVYCGVRDTSFPHSTATLWNKLQLEAEDAVFDVSYFPEGHDFLVSRSQEIFAKIETSLRSEVVSASPSSLSLALSSSSLAGMTSQRRLTHSIQWRALGPPVRRSQLPSGVVDLQNLVAVRLGKPLTNDIPSLQNANSASLKIESALKSTHGLVVVAGEHEFCFENNFKPDVDECWQFTQLLQTCVQENWEGKIVLVCPASVSGAMPVGVSKAFAMEYPDITFTRVYHDSQSPVTLTTVTTLLTATLNHALESDIHVQGCDKAKLTLLSPRAVHKPESTGKVSLDTTLNPGGKYVITGGTGGVGRSFVNWLISDYNVSPSALYVLCRNSQTDGAMSLTERKVNVIQCDVGDPEAVRTNQHLDTLTDVDGVFHLAGALDDGLVGSMTKESIEKVVGAKALGISALLEKAQKKVWGLDFVVNFSSTSSLFGYPAQSNYCAANSVLDQMATWGLGLESDSDAVRVLTINWGPWGEAGMAAKGSKAYAQAIKDSDFPLSNVNAFRELRYILSQLSEVPTMNQEFMVCDVDWTRSQWRQSRLVKDLVDENAGARPDSGFDYDDKNAETDSTDSAIFDVADDNDDIETLMRSMVPSWSLFETLPAVGLDSLDIVQMRNAIVKELKVNVALSIFNAPNRTLGELLSMVRTAKQTQHSQTS